MAAYAAHDDSNDNDAWIHDKRLHALQLQNQILKNIPADLQLPRLLLPWGTLIPFPGDPSFYQPIYQLFLDHHTIEGAILDEDKSVAD